jgi:branched-chain amino acid aminotransferase
MLPEGVVDIDGVLARAADAKVSVFDRGYLYGDSVFEAMRTYGGKPFRGREHLERLARSCQLLRMSLPIAIEALDQRVARAIAATGFAECYLRIGVTRGVAPLGLPLSLAERPSVLIYALELNLPDPSIYREGIAVGLVHAPHGTGRSPAAGAKATNYLASLLALDDVRQRGCQEAIILGGSGEVLEGTTSNVFLVQGGELHTPSLSTGILEGITRRTVLEVAKQAGVSCHERELTVAELRAAQEVFVTSSIREIVPVVRVDDAVIANGKPGPMVEALIAGYRRCT